MTLTGALAPRREVWHEAPVTKLAGTAPRVVSMTPAVFHLSDAVNAISRDYGVQPIVPRGPRLQPLIDGVRQSIREVLACPEHEPILFTGTGSSAMAAVLGSCLRPDERLVVARNGAYGDRILEFARTIGQPVIDVSAPYGARPDLAEVERLFASDEADAVAMVYGTTSTCAKNPLPELGALTRRYGKKLLVDGVSALFVEPMELAAWNVAAVMGSCNKGLHSHPNLTMALVRQDLLEAMEHIAPRAPSLELWKIHRAQTKGSHPYTIDPMSLLQVRAALNHLRDQGGVAARHATYLQRCQLLRAGYDRLGLKVAEWEGMPLSSIGTALFIPEGHTYDELAERLANEPEDGHVFEIYAAQGKLSSEVFRIFHMGDYELSVYELFLRSLGRVLGR